MVNTLLQIIGIERNFQDNQDHSEIQRSTQNFRVSSSPMTFVESFAAAFLTG